MGFTLGARVAALGAIEGVARWALDRFDHDRVPGEVVVVVDLEALDPVRRVVVATVVHPNAVEEQELAVHVRILPEQPKGDQRRGGVGDNRVGAGP